jgi:hypothetical protein
MQRQVDAMRQRQIKKELGKLRLMFAQFSTHNFPFDPNHPMEMTAKQRLLASYLTASLLILFVVGCGPTLQQQYEESVKFAQDTCKRDIIDNPVLQQILPLGLDGGRPSPELMSYQNFPTLDQLDAIRHWLRVRSNCAEAWIAAKNLRGHQFGTNTRLLVSAMDRVDGAFLTGQYTWATYAQTRSQMIDEYERIDSQLALEAQRDAYAQQQAAAAASAAWAAQMQALGNAIQAQQPQQPTRTNCQAFGNQLNCTQW